MHRRVAENGCTWHFGIFLPYGCDPRDREEFLLIVRDWFGPVCVGKRSEIFYLWNFYALCMCFSEVHIVLFNTYKFRKTFSTYMCWNGYRKPPALPSALHHLTDGSWHPYIAGRKGSKNIDSLLPQKNHRSRDHRLWTSIHLLHDTG